MLVAMHFTTRVLLIYLSFAFCANGSGVDNLLGAHENTLERPLPVKGVLPQQKVPDPSYHEDIPMIPLNGNIQPTRRTTTPITPLDDPIGNPHNLKYRHRMNSKQSLVAGLDSLRPIDERLCLPPELLANTTMSSSVQCARTCRKGDRKTCYYRFVVENYQVNGLACSLCTPDVTNSFCSKCDCVLADGVERSMMSVNRQLPGPSIEVCEGDHVVIDVDNHMLGTAFAIHWHGLYQKGFQYYDGVPFVTQCPIFGGTSFRYQWGANNAGTHFWHAHTGLQKMDGIFGSIIVRKPPEEDIHSHLYDYDLSTHVIAINDWMHKQAISYFPGRRFSHLGQLPDTILVNGKGRYTDPKTGRTTNTTLEVINVEHGKRYRIRLINAFCTVCPGMFTIQDHKMTIIATDGQDVDPKVVDSVTSFAGERYDFVLEANKTIGSYWIQVRGMGGCSEYGVQQLAILRYKGASNKTQQPEPSYYGGLPQGLVLNALNATCETPVDNTFCVSNLDSKDRIDPRILRRKPDVKFYLPVGFEQYRLQEAFEPNQYRRFMVASGRATITGIIDGISFKFPHSPVLSQPKDVPTNEFCNRKTVPEVCKDGACICTHTLDIPKNAVVEILLVDELQAVNLSHPFHMHGTAFYVMGMGRNHNDNSINWKIVREMDKKNLLNRWFEKPVKKDTVVIPYNGYVVLRFLADNPGYWLFHCHFIYHQMVGMEILLRVGDLKDVPPVPKDFPKCGDYAPPAGYNAYPPFVKNTQKQR